MMNDVSQGWTLIRWEEEEDRMVAEHFDSQEELLLDCEQNEIDPSTCFVFKGKLEPMGLTRKLSVVELEDLEDEDEEDSESTSKEESNKTPARTYFEF